MARVNYNVVTHGVSGKVGDLLIFIQRHGKTFLGKIHARSGQTSSGQLAVREKFNQAAKYAQACLQDPAIKDLYSERAGRGVTPFNLALADFFEAPVITEINSSDYTGAIGSTIKVQATDDTKVKTVTIRIEAANGSLVEEGPASEEAGSGQWLYTATAANAVLTGSKINATATDLPGNSTSAEKVI